MPARRAIVLGRRAVEPAARRTRRSRRRASSSRRSSAVFRVVRRATCRKLVTHSQRCQAPARRARAPPRSVALERQRERPLEGAVGARERALVTVRRRAAAARRCRSAPRSPARERGEHLVAAVELDDVGLPAVAIALVGRGQRDGRCARRSAYPPATRSRAARSSSSRRSCGMPTAQRMSGRR